MKKLIIIINLICIFNIAHSQVEKSIGMSPETFIRLNRAQRKHVDIKYYNGQISELITCDNQIAFEIQKRLNLCKIFEVKEDKIKSVYIRFENTSLEEIKELYSKKYNKIDKYYFLNDYEYYYSIYLPSDGYPTAQLHVADKSKFSNVILQQIEKQKKKAEIESLEREKRNNEINSIKSLQYDIKEDYPQKYQKMQKELQSRLILTISCLSHIDEKSYNRHFDKTNIHNMYGEYNQLLNQQDPIHFAFTLNIFQWTERDVIYTEKVNQNNYTTITNNLGFEDISHGILKDIASKIKYMHAELPQFKEKGVSVNTKVEFQFDIDYLKGAFVLKIKKGEITFLKRTEPENLKIKEKIKNEISKKYSDGRYKFMYEKIKVNDKEEIHFYQY